MSIAGAGGVFDLRFFGFSSAGRTSHEVARGCLHPVVSYGVYFPVWVFDLDLLTSKKKPICLCMTKA